MPYDKENVDKADKAGVFDSPMDAPILSTEDEERMKIKKDIDDITKKDSEEKDEDFETKSRRKSKKDLKEENEKLKKKIKLNIWERFIYWLKGIFGGAVSQYRFLNKKELKRAKHIIQNFNPVFYNFKDPNSVKPRIKKEFARVMYDIYNTYLKIYYLFEDAIINEDDIKPNEESFFLKYESELISDSAKNILERLSKKRIYELYDHHDSANMTIERELHNLKSDIESKDIKNIETYSEVFENILLLRKIGFEDFFRLFDKDFVTSIKYRPNFNHNIYVNELRDCDNFLKDLNNYFSSFKEVSMPENVGVHFDSVLRDFIDIEEDAEETDEDGMSIIIGDDMIQTEGEEPQEEEKPIKKEKKKDTKYSGMKISSKEVKELLKSIQYLVKSEVITAMVKYVYQDATYETHTVPFSNTFYDKFVSVLTTKILKISKQSEQQIKDKHLKENIRALFNIEDDSDVNIPFLGNYNPEVNKKLEEKKLRTFEHVKAIALIKMFFDKHYFKYIRELIDKLVVEGEFSDKSIGTQFSNYIYELEDDYKNLLSFKKQMEESESVKVLLRGLNASGSLDPSQKSVLVNKISELNSTAKNIIESTLPKLLEIQNIIQNALEDSHTKNPRFIYNIKSIGGLANKTYLNQLASISKKITQFLKIMKNFHLVVSSEFKKRK